MEVKLYLTGGPITVLGDNKIGNVFAVGFRIIVGFAVNKHDNVGVLLD